MFELCSGWSGRPILSMRMGLGWRDNDNSLVGDLNFPEWRRDADLLQPVQRKRRTGAGVVELVLLVVAAEG
jgi:hypothetical protein